MLSTKILIRWVKVSHVRTTQTNTFVTSAQMVRAGSVHATIVDCTCLPVNALYNDVFNYAYKSTIVTLLSTIT